MTRRQFDPVGWPRYLHEFHAQHPGITEDILGAATSAGQNPYEWLLELIPDGANVLDIACGSAPLLAAGWRGSWVGIDQSERELARARLNGAQHVVAADADHLPFEDGSFTAVACSMALMLLQPLDDCLAEIARVLAPGGSFAVLIPAGAGPLNARDLWRWTRLLGALRRVRLAYPNDRATRRLPEALHPHALTIGADRCRRFAYPIADEGAAERFVESLYLPGVATGRAADARRVARGWVDSEIGIPLRRLAIQAPL